ncbi:MAG: reverse transcriptase family protein, partial [Bacteroidales bacterium]
VKPKDWQEMRNLMIEKWIMESVIQEQETQRINISKMIEEAVDKRMSETKINRNRSSQNRSTKQDSEVVCYKCNKAGHYAIGCASSRTNKRKEDYLYVRQEKYKYKTSDGNKRLKVSIEEILSDYPEVVDTEDSDKPVKFCQVEKCCIKTKGEDKIVKRGYVIPQALREKTRRLIYRLEKRGIIRKSDSQWRNPIRALQKPNGEIRLVCNMMALNDITETDSYAMADMKRIIEATVGSNNLTILDLKDAYHQIEINEVDKFKTAFEFEKNVYEWNGMMQGFKNAPMVFQRIMDKIMNDLIGKGVEIYLDDLIIYSKTAEEHDRLIKEVFKRLVTNNLKINVKKVQYNQSEVKLLGVTVNGRDRIPIEVTKNNALEYPRPKNIGQLRRFLGMCNWFRDFIPRFASIAKPMYDSLKTKSEFIWNIEQETGFVKIKQALREAKGLKLPEYDKEFTLKTDASNHGLGAVLLQKNNDGKLVPVQWASKKLTPTETRYGISEKEMLAIVF